MSSSSFTREMKGCIAAAYPRLPAGGKPIVSITVNVSGELRGGIGVNEADKSKGDRIKRSPYSIPVFPPRPPVAAGGKPLR
jgi:hypothetical protein